MPYSYLEFVNVSTFYCGNLAITLYFHKALEKILNVFGVYLTSMNIPPRKEERPDIYAYFLRVGGKLCLLIGVNSLLFLRSRSKNPALPTPHHLPLHFYALCFTPGKFVIVAT
jgi:hypothetical protein